MCRDPALSSTGEGGFFKVRFSISTPLRFLPKPAISLDLTKNPDFILAAELSCPLGTRREIVLCSHCFWQFIYSNETIHSSPGAHQTETVFSSALHNKYTVFQHYGFTFNSVYPIQHAFALDPWIIYSWQCWFCYCTCLWVVFVQLNAAP